jgi:hypothetical protein
MFPVRYKLNLDISFRRDSIFKLLNTFLKDFLAMLYLYNLIPLSCINLQA